jgi:hypothetical protein
MWSIVLILYNLPFLMDNLEHIAGLVNSMNMDIKAEVVAANLLEQGFEQDGIAAFHMGQFKRAYSRDILYADLVSLTNYREALGLFLSRDGIYDELPEGLFHEFSSSPLDSGKEMASESRILKKQEENSRRFFQPLEQEFFYHKVLLEEEERRLLGKLESHNYQDIFREFWKISPDLPSELVSEMILILPFAHRITGDYALTSECLSALLSEKVDHRTYQIRKNFQSHTESGRRSRNQLGNCSLGGDLIAGDTFHEICPAIEFIIGPLVNSDIEEYIGNGSRVDFIRCFFSFFVPVGLECTFSIEKPVKFHFSLLEGEEAPVMGYNTII